MPSGSRKRGSSATSPRTPSTTTPRTSRRMLESRIMTLEDKLRSAAVIDAKELSADVVRVGSQVQVTRRQEQEADVTSSSARPRRTRRRTSSPTSRRSARRSWAASSDKGQGDPPQRQAARADGRQDRSRVAAVDRGVDLRAPRRPPPQAREPARGGRRAVPARLPGCDADRRREGAARRPGRRGGDGGATYAWPAASTPARGQGKMAFLDLVDRTGRIQLQARLDVLGDEACRTPARPAGPRRPDRRRRHDLQVPAAASSSPARRRLDRCWPKSLRPPPDDPLRPARTPRPASATASST